MKNQMENKNPRKQKAYTRRKHSSPSDSFTLCRKWYLSIAKWIEYKHLFVPSGNADLLIMLYKARKEREGNY